MKKIIFAIILLMTPLYAQATPYSYLDAPNPTNRNFSGLMQQKFEKEETLDFINNPQEYKTKREKKDAYLDYQEGKGEIPEFMKPKINNTSNQNIKNMEFQTDENGQIKIQGRK